MRQIPRRATSPVERGAALTFRDPTVYEPREPSLPVQREEREELHRDHDEDEHDADQWDIEDRSGLGSEVADPLDRSPSHQPDRRHGSDQPRLIDDRAHEEEDRDREREGPDEILDHRDRCYGRLPPHPPASDRTRVATV